MAPNTLDGFINIVKTELVNANDIGYYIQENALDIDYIISSENQYKGAILTIIAGGPNVYIDTLQAKIIGYWGNHSKRVSIPATVTDDIDFILYDCWYNLTR